MVKKSADALQKDINRLRREHDALKAKEARKAEKKASILAQYDKEHPDEQEDDDDKEDVGDGELSADYKV
jgi:hypothetical protein